MRTYRYDLDLFDFQGFNKLLHIKRKRSARVKKRRGYYRILLALYELAKSTIFLNKKSWKNTSYVVRDRKNYIKSLGQIEDVLLSDLPDDATISKFDLESIRILVYTTNLINDYMLGLIDIKIKSIKYLKYGEIDTYQSITIKEIKTGKYYFMEFDPYFYYRKTNPIREINMINKVIL